MNYKVLSSDIFAVCLWLYIITNTTLYIYSYSVHYFIEATCLMLMVIIWLSFGNIKKRNFYDKTVILFILSILCLILPDLLSINIIGLKKGINLFLPIIILFLIISRRTNLLNSKLFCFIPLFYGFFISLQSLLLELLSFCAVNVGGNYEVIQKNGGQTRFVYDYFLGLQSTIFNLGGGHKLLRLNGYYLEPAKFAFFLIIPFFLSYFKYQETRKKIFLFMFIIIGLCLFFTFSRAGYISIIIALGIYKTLTKRRKKFSSKYKDITKICIKSVAIIGLIYLFFLTVDFFVQNKSSTYYYLLRHFTFSENGQVTLVRNESSNFIEIFKLLVKQPYGYGMTILIHDGGENDYNVANALSFWLYGSGFLGTIFILYNLFQIFINYAIYSLKSSNYTLKAFGLIFVAQTIFAFSYGTWMNMDFIFTIGIMIIIYLERYKCNEMLDCC